MSDASSPETTSHDTTRHDVTAHDATTHDVTAHDATTHDTTAATPGRDIIVLESFPQPRPTTNPYVVMLRDALEATPGIELLTFSWKRALLGNYDVFHAHWPEILSNGASPAKTVAREVFTAALVARLALTGTPVVRTLHNLERPTGLNPVQSALLDAIEALTRAHVLINPVGDAPGGGASARVLHGHYRTWFAQLPKALPVPHQFSYAGLIRRYKGVENLLEAFAGTPAGARLRVGGNPTSDELRQRVEDAVAADPRISATLKFLSDAELVDVITSGELVVLPYRHMHNSGAALAALSLDRPVLVPDNEANRALRNEMGTGWVHLFSGELTADALEAALVASTERTEHPDMSARNWDDCGPAHLKLFASVLTPPRPRRIATQLGALLRAGRR